jgi:hypothetical protein
MAKPSKEPRKFSVTVDEMRAVGIVTKSNTCVCGKHKWSSNPFCTSCWKQLTEQERGAMIRQLKRSHVLAFQDICKRLNYTIPVPPPRKPQEKVTA